MNAFETSGFFEPLSQREVEILHLVSEGFSNRVIAQKLHLSLETVKWYNKSIYRKLGVHSRGQAAAKALQYGLLKPAPKATQSEGARPRHNLPAQLTSFVGREREIEEIKGLLRSSRLVVLTGAGGTGKTRLALQVAWELAREFRDGAWLVELAHLIEPSMAANEIAQTLGFSERGDLPPIENLKFNLAAKHLLLLLDNFEHLLEAAPLVGELLGTTPQITILATSRERLHVYGEQEYPVQPLALPDLQSITSIEQLMEFDAVNLFVQRTQAVDPGFTLKDEQADAVVKICIHLDGLPLALELAASQIKMFSPFVLAQRLGEHLGGLTGGARDLPARQRTLHDTITWSYDLLSEEEQVFFARLSVFRGGGSLNAIERVCAPGLPGDVLVMLSSLVDKSLVYSREGPSDEQRFTMLETIREYAWECLETRGETLELKRRHAGYIADLAERAEGELRRARQVYWFPRLQEEQDNLRAALAWSLEGAEYKYGLRMAGALRDWWYYGGYTAEGLRWTNLALERIHAAPPALRAGVLRSAALIAFARSDHHRGKEMQLQALDLYRQLGDQRNAAWSMIFLSAHAMEHPDQYQAGIDQCLEGLELFRELGDKPGLAQALNILGEFYRLQGDDDAASEVYEESLAIVNETGEKLRTASLLENLSYIAHHRGEDQRAEMLVKQGIKILQEMKNDYGLLNFISSLAGSIAALGNPERAARLLGASETLSEAMGASLQPGDIPEIERIVNEVRGQLGEEAFQTAWESGSSMTLEESVAFALEEQDSLI